MPASKTLILGTLYGLLILWGVYETLFVDKALSPQSPAIVGVEVSAEAVKVSTAILPALLEEITQRPLFEPGRRVPQKSSQLAKRVPKQPAATGKNDAVKQPKKRIPPFPTVRLTAIVQDGPRRQALLETIDGHEATLVSLNGKYAGWMLQSIDSEQVVFVRDNTRRVLKLYAFDENENNDRGTPSAVRPRQGAKRQAASQASASR